MLSHILKRLFFVVYLVEMAVTINAPVEAYTVRRAANSPHTKSLPRITSNLILSSSVRKITDFDHTPPQFPTINSTKRSAQSCAFQRNFFYIYSPSVGGVIEA